MQTDKGIVLASVLIEHLRRQSIILPALNAVERASAEAITRANRCIYEALNALRGHGQTIDDALLQYLSPLGWEHINLTGDYLWRSSAKIGVGKFRSLRPLQSA